MLSPGDAVRVAGVGWRGAGPWNPQQGTASASLGSGCLPNTLEPPSPVHRELGPTQETRGTVAQPAVAGSKAGLSGAKGLRTCLHQPLPPS